jgi:ubiquitin carboxyl-terminal hydrolase L3
MTSSTITPTKQAYRKHFIPLESNPDVFTELAHKLGLGQNLCFQDVLSIDDSEILAFMERETYALILVFPTTEAYEKRCAREEVAVNEYDRSGLDEPVVFFKQTINNACGLYALLHAICNGSARRRIGRLSVPFLNHVHKVIVTDGPDALCSRADACEQKGRGPS